MATSNEIRILLNAIYKGAGIVQAESDIKKLALEVAKAGAILAGFATIVKKAYDFGEEGAKIERLRESGTKLAESYGADMEEAILRIKAASHGAITANAAVSESNRAMLLNVARDSETIAKLVEIAAIRGRAAGLSAQEAFDRITLGIGRLSTRILDDIGIVVDGETAYAEYGKAIGKVADDLTEAEKRQALTNAIIEDGNELLKRTGGVTDDAANAFERWETHITDTTNALKQHISEGVAPLIKTLDIWLFGQRDINNALQLHSIEVLKNAKTYEEYKSELERAADAGGLFVRSNGDLVRVTRTRTGYNEELIKSEYLLSRAGFDSVRATDDRREAIDRLNKTLEYQEERENAITEALKKLNDISGKTLDFGFEEAAKKAIEFNEKAGTLTPEALDKLRVAFGLADEAIFKFRDALEVAGKDGVITLKELQDAFKPVAFEQAAQKTLELWEKVDKKIQELRDKYKQDVIDSERELADDMIDAATKRDRDLADLEEDAQKDRDEAVADANKKSQREEEDRESAHQRRLQKIWDKYNRARIQALIDLDAKALFEAELTRDQELKDAEADRKERKEQAEKELKDKIEDIQDNYDEKRREILRQYDRDLEDAKEADRRRKRDLQRALDEQIREQNRYRDEEMRDIEKFLADRFTTETLDYQQRISDLIRYWQDRLHINAMYQDIENGGTGGVPYGEEPGPPVGSPVGPPDTAPYIPPGGGPEPAIMANMTAGGVGGTGITVTLNVVGDGMLAAAVRAAALNAVVDVVAA